ncbi:hypothetical protein IW262DRAFT_630427 [Armillaria fumosa]|nr:hypothetical protein IW262DRAFT_630427 [Armillaria fumosa]
MVMVGKQVGKERRQRRYSVKEAQRKERDEGKIQKVRRKLPSQLQSRLCHVLPAGSGLPIPSSRRALFRSIVIYSFLYSISISNMLLEERPAVSIIDRACMYSIVSGCDIRKWANIITGSCRGTMTLPETFAEIKCFTCAQGSAKKRTPEMNRV